MSTALQVFVDGRPCSESWPQDRALQYGDGLFETMLVRNGRIRFEALHRARLAQGCNRLAITADHAAIWRQARQLASGLGAALLKLQLTRGDATTRGYAPSGVERTRVILSVYPAPTAADLPATVRAVTLRNSLGENPDLAGLKHCNRLEQVLARASLQGTDAFEGLMASSSGLLISGTMSNVFVELDGLLVTPELDLCGIAGVLRAVVLREAQQAALSVRIARIPMSALERCTSLAVSNVRLGLLSVHELNGRKLGLQSSLRELAARIDLLDE
ncbi:MAG: aminodeoxychorismate lyase [Steroidobacteraceae bacterium]